MKNKISLKKKILTLLFTWFSLSGVCFAQSVGIGTTTPNSKALLEIKSTTQGVLFPRMTTAQRNAISNPPNGLHIFNTDDGCLNYYDSLNSAWACYCNTCETVIININYNPCNLNFYNTYAKDRRAKKYIVNIGSDVVILGCSPGDNAFSFVNMPFDADITINNHGIITGAGGSGGNGTIEYECGGDITAHPGQNGGNAFVTRSGVLLTINNYGYIEGGGGGGGGSGSNDLNNPYGGGQYGGGGGGGAGIVAGQGGKGGGYTSDPYCGESNAIRYMPGSVGQQTTGGAGGNGTNGGAPGGNGGDRAQPGLHGAGRLSSAATGGAAGKAVAGGSGNIINNVSGGQYFGVVD